MKLMEIVEKTLMKLLKINQLIHYVEKSPITNSFMMGQN